MAVEAGFGDIKQHQKEGDTMKSKDIKTILIVAAGVAVYDILGKDILDILKNVLKGVTGGNSGNQAVTK